MGEMDKIILIVIYIDIINVLQIRDKIIRGGLALDDTGKLKYCDLSYQYI